MLTDTSRSTPPEGGPAYEASSQGNATTIRRVRIEQVRVPSRRLRSLADVTALQSSIATMGLLQPLVVDEALLLLCGLHRLEACRRLGWTEVPVVVAPAQGPRARLAEIDENLCRRELSALERAEHLAQRKQLWEELGSPMLQPEPVEGEPDPKKKPSKPQPESVLEAFLADTERRTGRGRAVIKEELKIGALPEEVRDLARETPVSHSKKELLALTRMPEPEQRSALEAVRSGDATSVRKKTPRAKKGPATAAPGAEGGASVPPWEEAAPQASLLAEEDLREPVEAPPPSLEAGPRDPWRDHWTAVARSLGRAEYELEQALASWPEDPMVVSDEDAGRETLRRAIEALRPLSRGARARVLGGAFRTEG